MTSKLLRHAASLSLATLLLGTALPSSAHTVSVAQTDPSAQSDSVSPNPANDPQYILANLDKVNPLSLSHVIADEWQKGNRLRASFWYFIWQIRTDAWVEGLDEEGFTVFRNMISDQMGQAINTWIAADPALMRDTAERAIGYEVKLPLSNEKPEDVSDTDWQAIIAKSRADYATDLRDAFADITDAEILASRQQNGLPVGTPSDLGAPLPDDWR